MFDASRWRCNCHAKTETAGSPVTHLFSDRKTGVFEESERRKLRLVAALSRGGGFQPLPPMLAHPQLPANTKTRGSVRAGKKLVILRSYLDCAPCQIVRMVTRFRTR